MNFYLHIKHGMLVRAIPNHQPNPVTSTSLSNHIPTECSESHSWPSIPVTEESAQNIQNQPPLPRVQRVANSLVVFLGKRGARGEKTLLIEKKGFLPSYSLAAFQSWTPPKVLGILFLNKLIQRRKIFWSHIW